MTPLPAPQALDAYFLEARARAARPGRHPGPDRPRGRPAAALADPRLQKLRQALEILLARPDGRAEAVQQLFSLDYDPDWKRPRPR